MINAGIRNQNLILFIRGNAISAAPNIRGTNQLPNPPIKIGITIKKNHNKRHNIANSNNSKLRSTKNSMSNNNKNNKVKKKK